MENEERWKKVQRWLQRHKVIPAPPTPLPNPIPTPAPTSGRHARLLTDMELAEYNFKSRTADPNWRGNPMTPMTFRIFGGNGKGKISIVGQLVVKTLDTVHNTFNYVTNRHGGWVNGGVWPDVVEEVTFSGADNQFEVLSVDAVNDRAYIRTYNNETVYDRYVMHQWVNVDKSGRMFGCQNPKGDGMGFILVTGPKNAWVPLHKLKFVD